MQSCIDDSSASEWNLYRQPFLVKDILLHLDLEKSNFQKHFVRYGNADMH